MVLAGTRGVLGLAVIGFFVTIMGSGAVGIAMAAVTVLPAVGVLALVTAAVTTTVVGRLGHVEVRLGQVVDGRIGVELAHDDVVPGGHASLGRDRLGVVEVAEGERAGGARLGTGRQLRSASSGTVVVKPLSR